MPKVENPLIMRMLWVWLWLALAGWSWAHEGGQVEADARWVIGAQQVTYEVRFRDRQAEAEWGELDVDKDGRLSQAEVDRYQQAEQLWFAQPFVANPAVELVPGGFQVEGGPEAVVVRCRWTWTRPTQGHIQLVGFSHFRGRHEVELEQGSGAFSAPELKWTEAGGAHRWSYDNRGGELLGALESKSLWGGLTLAFFLGALHGLTPGHGKTIVGAYLIGSKGTIGHAIFLGLVVTLTHTSSVVILGMVCLFVFQSYLPPWVIPWIGVVSGLLITALGLSLLSRQAPGFLHHHHDHDHDHHHGHGHHHHGHGHHHHHAIPDRLDLKGLVSLGVSGGMVPCPEAMAVLLTALALNKLAIGMMILLAFSSGLAAILVLIGVVMVTAARFFENRYPSSGTISRLSDFSYVVMIFMGLVIAGRSLWEAGFK